MADLAGQVQRKPSTVVELTGWLAPVGTHGCDRRRLFRRSAAQPFPAHQARGRCGILARRRRVSRRADRAWPPRTLARHFRDHGGNHRGQSPRRPQSLGRRALCAVQCGGGRAHGLADRALFRRGLQTDQAAQCAGIGCSGRRRRRGFRRRGRHRVQAVSQHGCAAAHDLAALVCFRRIGNYHRCACLVELAAASRDRPPFGELRRGFDGRSHSRLSAHLPFSCAPSCWRMSDRLPCCSPRCCGSPRAAGRSLPPRPLSSSACRSSGRRPLALAISAIRTLRWMNACSRRRSAFCWSQLAPPCWPRCFPSSGTRGNWPKPRCMPAKRNAI